RDTRSVETRLVLQMRAEQERRTWSATVVHWREPSRVHTPRLGALTSRVTSRSMLPSARVVLLQAFRAIQLVDLLFTPRVMPARSTGYGAGSILIRAMRISARLLGTRLAPRAGAGRFTLRVQVRAGLR